ncbi:hypothetical protein Btru_052540 [Bulinus truncatus]|nr:hypothetical protein Btru_052540 [Bulinus truncatus]
MRPDEHKKKKNDAYKRKHGITSGSNTGRSKDKDPAFGGDFKQKGKNKQNSANEKSDGKNEQISKFNKRLETKVKDLERFHDEIKVLSTSSSSESEKKISQSEKTRRL